MDALTPDEQTALRQIPEALYVALAMQVRAADPRCTVEAMDRAVLVQWQMTQEEND